MFWKIGFPWKQDLVYIRMCALIKLHLQTSRGKKVYDQIVLKIG